MDRLMVYPGAIPLDTDVLSVERNVMKALGWLTQATFGTGTGVVGMPCNPTVPASMTVNVGPGAIWAQGQVDQMPFGSLAADASPLMKMGILPKAVGTNFTLTAPSVSGQSIAYLIEATFAEVDENPVVLPYVNPANPAQPFTGPDNAGTPQNTVRAQLVDLQLKAGVAANTGTQVTPSVDTGYVGLYVITVNYGQTAITASDITEYENAPFVGGPFAALAGNAGQTFMGAPATQNNQLTTLGQFQYWGHAGAFSPSQTVLSTSISFTAPFDCLIFSDCGGNTATGQVVNDQGTANIVAVNANRVYLNSVWAAPTTGYGMYWMAAVFTASAGAQVTLTGTSTEGTTPGGIGVGLKYNIIPIA